MVSIMILKCIGAHCKSDDEIKAFLDNNYFSFEYLADAVDFTKFGEKPMKRVSKPLMATFLDLDKFQLFQSDVQYNQISTQDSFI